MSQKKNTPVPANEPSRLKALQEYQILDTLPEQSYDDIAKLAAHICCVDKGMVAFIDDHRKWHKARYNIAPIEVPREFSICSHTIMGTQPYIVPDTGVCQDSWHPLVKFYAALSSSFFAGLSGFRVTTPTGSQFLTSLDQRNGLLAFAASRTALRFANTSLSFSE